MPACQIKEHQFLQLAGIFFTMRPGQFKMPKTVHTHNSGIHPLATEQIRPLLTPKQQSGQILIVQGLFALQSTLQLTIPECNTIHQPQKERLQSLLLPRHLLQ